MEHGRGRVLFVSHGAGLDGGAEYVFVEMLQALRTVAPALEISVVVPGEGAVAEAARGLHAHVHIRAVPRWADFGSPGLRGRLRRLLALAAALPAAWVLVKQLRPDLVVSNTMTVPVHAAAARARGVPHVWCVQEFGNRDHDLTFLLGFRLTVRLISALSERVVCCSHAVASALRAVVPSVPASVAYYAVEAPALPSPASGPVPPLKAILVGRLTEAKGQDLAVRAVDEARRQGADVRLTLVGPGDPAPVRALIDDLEVGGAVDVAGSSSDVYGHLVRHHVALMCSRDEAFGRVTVEALKAGLPVCGTDAGGTREIVVHRENGLLSPVGDHVAMAQNLVLLAQDESVRQALSRGALRARQEYSLERYGLALCREFGIQEDDQPERT